MRGDIDNNNNNNRRSKLSALRKRLLSRKRYSSAQPLGREGDASAADGVEDGDDFVRVRGEQGRVREVMRRSFVALMTSVIIRSSFNPQAASAMGLYRPKLGASSSRQVQSDTAVVILILILLARHDYSDSWSAVWKGVLHCVVFDHQARLRGVAGTCILYMVYTTEYIGV